VIAQAHILIRLDRAESDYLAAKKRSGKPWTEERYREAGIQLLHIRLRRETHEPLDELAEQWGLSRGEAVKRAIAEAHARHVAPYGRPPVEQAFEASAVVTREPLNTRARKQKSDKSE
jgi:ribbon-helix-helix CopG family protein